MEDWRNRIGKHNSQLCWLIVHVDRNDVKKKEDEVIGMTNNTSKKENCNRNWQQICVFASSGASFYIKDL